MDCSRRNVEFHGTGMHQLKSGENWVTLADKSRCMRTQQREMCKIAPGNNKDKT